MFKMLLNKFVKNNNTKSSNTGAVQNKVSTSGVTEKITPPKLNMFEFNVAGVTAKNENKQDIQKLLKQQGKIYAKENQIDFYGGYKNKEIIEDNIEISEFEDLVFYKDELSFIPEPTNEYDSNAIKIFIKYSELPVHIGYVPNDKNVELKNILDNEDVRRIEARYVGGKIKSVEYDSDEDKDIIVTEEITLGIEIKVFYKPAKED
ncbi:HIRAN domain-containing protein [Evansella sp. AB-rgal1]|uniref:HIRAN domain-containing protein n=1 Tax=Evansella sp. AB-rgal1 TaxID=3242696 RepID=UPI00359EDA45